MPSVQGRHVTGATSQTKRWTRRAKEKDVVVRTDFSDMFRKYSPYLCLLSQLIPGRFVDCPGHDILMSTMLSGAAVMDAALLLIAGNESCPQPQTSEHLAAIEIMKLQHMIILQTKSI